MSSAELDLQETAASRVNASSPYLEPRSHSVLASGGSGPIHSDYSSSLSPDLVRSRSITFQMAVYAYIRITGKKLA